MNKRGKIIEIRGIKGLLIAIFAGCCIITGFTVFPGYIAMNLWNLVAKYIDNMPTMQLLHGVMLWIIVFLLWYAFGGKYLGIHIGFDPSDENIKELVEQIQYENKDNEDKKD